MIRLHEKGLIKFCNIKQSGKRSRWRIVISPVQLSFGITAFIENDMPKEMIERVMDSAVDPDPDKCPIISPIVNLDGKSSESSSGDASSAEEPPSKRKFERRMPPPPFPTMFRFPPFIRDLIAMCTAVDVQGRCIANEPDHVIKWLCMQAPDWEIAVALEEVREFSPKGGGEIMHVKNALKHRFVKDEDGLGHLNADRQNEMAGAAHLLEAYRKRCEKYERECEITAGSLLSVIQVDKMCMTWQSGGYVETEEIPGVLLSKIEIALEPHPEWGRRALRLSDNACVVLKQRGAWWIGKRIESPRLPEPADYEKRERYDQWG